MRLWVSPSRRGEDQVDLSAMSAMRLKLAPAGRLSVCGFAEPLAPGSLQAERRNREAWL
jgi:hypothetical protein